MRFGKQVDPKCTDIFYDLLFVTERYKYGDDAKLCGCVQQINVEEICISVISFTKNTNDDYYYIILFLLFNLQAERVLSMAD
jgi:hypothetical protein